jgi:hypothetical protein
MTLIADPQKIDALSVYIQNWNTQRFRVRPYKYRNLDILRESLHKVKGRSGIPARMVYP